VIELIVVCIQAGNDPTETLESGELTEHEGGELIAARELTNAFVPLIFLNEGIECVGVEEVSDLGKDVAILDHEKRREM
jgi:hypothetical protein